MNDNITEKNIACEIISDLLPLYHDGVVNGVTENAVKTHLEACPKCTEEYNALCKQLPAKIAEASTKNQFSDMMKKRKIKHILLTIIVSIIACAVLAGAFYLLTQVPLVKVPDSKIKICRTYAYETNDGLKIYVLFQKPAYRVSSTFRSDINESTNTKEIMQFKPLIAKETFMVDDGFIINLVPGEPSYDIKFAGETIWTEGDTADTNIPDYVYARDDFENHINVKTWHSDIDNGYVGAGYKDGRTVFWDLDGNVISDTMLHNVDGNPLE